VRQVFVYDDPDLEPEHRRQSAAIDCETHLLAVLHSVLEGWLVDHISYQGLPEVDWPGLFGASAVEAKAQYESFRMEWGTWPRNRDPPDGGRESK
jgi:hypothetical protein